MGLINQALPPEIMPLRDETVVAGFAFTIRSAVDPTLVLRQRSILGLQRSWEFRIRETLGSWKLRTMEGSDAEKVYRAAHG